MTEFSGGLNDVINYLQKVCSSSNRGDYILSQFQNVVATKLEPKPFSFSTTTRRAASRLVLHMYKSCQEMLQQLRPTVGEATFLCATEEFLQKRTSQTGDEWSITGFGKHKKRGMAIGSYYKVSGDRHTVPLPKSLISRHVRQGAEHRALIVHSHPDNILTASLLGLPFASDHDREKVVEYGGNQWINAILGNVRQVRHFIVESGQIKEYFLPPGKEIENLIKELMNS